MNHLLLRGDARRIPLADGSVDLVIGSPPYVDARLYLEAGKNLGISRDAREWVDWMLGVTAEAVRVSRGLVLWVCAGVTRDHCYWPACEGLLWEWWQQGGQCWRPCYWHRVGIPGSGGKKWLRADVEYVLAFKGAGNEFWTDNTAMGHPPKWAPGGEMSYRLSDGTRTNQWGKTGVDTATRKTGDWVRNGGANPSHKLMYRRGHDGERQHTKRTLDGTMESQTYVPPTLANPGNYHTWEFAPDEDAWLSEAFIHPKVGGGHLGSDIAHESEAPFPEALAEFFVRSFCPESGTVLDPFSGSGTTAAVAAGRNRTGIGLDLRQSQCLIGQRRLERPHARTPRGTSTTKPGDDMPLFARRDTDTDTENGVQT